MRELKFRAWWKDTKRFLDCDEWYMTCSGAKYLHYAVMPYKDDNFIIEQYTGIKDKNGDKEIYEYDIIDGEGNIIGNYHETPELLEDKTNLLIQGFGTKTWLTTYQEAVERGCHDA